MPRYLPAMLLLAPLGLAACDEKPKQDPQAETRQQAMAEARRAAEEQVRARLRITGDMRLRAIQVYRQQIADSFAVCGQINPSGAATDPYVPWVVSTTVKDGKASGASLAIGLSNVEASRVYLEMVERCFEGGGPRSAQSPGIGGMPPLPADAALSRAAGPPTATPPATSPGTSPGAVANGAPAGGARPETNAARPEATGGAGRSLTTTNAHPVNIRSTPGGGSVVRIVPRASVLREFATAPGGWHQVGEDQPIGWVHDSVLER